MLDVGAGRDLQALLDAGYDARGAEPSEALRSAALAAFPALSGRLTAGQLPALDNPARSGRQGMTVLWSRLMGRIRGRTVG